MNLISDRGAIGSSCKTTLNGRVVDGEAAIRAEPFITQPPSWRMWENTFFGL